jgi:hypothetical protein
MCHDELRITQDVTTGTGSYQIKSHRPPWICTTQQQQQQQQQIYTCIQNLVINFIGLQLDNNPKE